MTQLARTMLTLAVLVAALPACSRHESARRGPTAAVDSATAFGPRVDLLPSADASAQPAVPLPVVDGAALLAKIRASDTKASWSTPGRAGAIPAAESYRCWRALRPSWPR